MQSNNFNHVSQDGFLMFKLSRVLPSKEAFKDGKELKKKRQIKKGKAYSAYKGEANSAKKIQPITCVCVFN